VLRGLQGLTHLHTVGHLELYHHIRNKLRFYNSVALTAQYVISSKVLDDLGGIQTVTFAALKTVLSLQPIMGVSVVDETPRAASWVRLDTIDLQEVTKFITIPGGQQFIEDEHQNTFERLGELPLWRVVVAEHQSDIAGSPVPGDADNSTQDTVFDVGFFYNHAMGDGLTGGAFHLEFLDALNALGAETGSSRIPLESVVEIPKLELLPSLDKAARFPLSIKFIGWEVIKEFILGDKDPKRWTGPPVMFSPETPPKTRMITILLESTISAKISARCRNNNVTITPLLTVLLARQLATAYPKYSRFLGTIAVQLRRFTGVSNRQMVNHVSGVTVKCSTATNGEKGYVSCSHVDWEAIRACKAVIDGAAKSPKNQITILLKFLSNAEEFFRSRVGKDRNYSFEVSNVGLVDGGLHHDGIAKFRRLVFSQSAIVAETPYVFGVASVKGGDMAIALTWQDGVLEEAKAKQVMEALQGELHLMAMDHDSDKANGVMNNDCP
jgi:hypothetical protein